MMQVNFFIIGAAKAGTSSLYYYVKQHPDVCMSVPKETWFFCFDDYLRGPQWYWDRYFAACYGGEQIVGEATPWYLHIPYVADRIYQYNPEAKFVAILRNPVDRAFSEWWMAFTAGVEHLPFEKAIALNLESLGRQVDLLGEIAESARQWRILRRQMSGPMPNIVARPRSYLQNGYYALQLEQYLHRFSADRVLILLFDDLVSEPEDVTRRVWAFLGLNPDVPLTDKEPRNVASGYTGGILLNTLRRVGAGKLLPVRVKRSIVRMLKTAGPKPHLTKEMQKLLVEHYYEHNRHLERIIGRDLRHWDAI